MKVIDLLKILLTQVGDIPKQVYFETFKYEYDEKENDYYCERTGYFLFANVLGDILETCFNLPITIMEEDKEIEKLEIYSDEENFNEKIHFKNILKVSKNGECEVTEEISAIVDKINELVEAVNELMKGK